MDEETHSQMNSEGSMSNSTGTGEKDNPETTVEESGGGIEGDSDQQPLSWVEEGDKIAVSSRETPMTVESIIEKMNGNRVVVASNHHGKYRLKGFPDGSITLWTGGKLDSTVSVDYAE